jgi:histidinol-phosphate aminotransferase
MALRDKVRFITPYTPGEQPRESGIIKLNTNECPYPPSPEFARTMAQIPPESFRLYPDPNENELRDALSEVYGIPKERIYAGVGSDEVLALAFLTFFTGGGPLLFPDITYSFYPVWADLYQIPVRTVPLDEYFRIHAEDYCTQEDKAGIIIANPNAPTGLYAGLDLIERILQANPGIVVIVDEAYIDFGGESALPLIDKYDNLVVVRTCSKSRSLAGLRIGYAFGPQMLMDALWAVRNSFNSYTLNHASIVGGAAAVRDTAYLKQTCERIIATRERLAGELRAMGFTFPPSSANFIFAKHETVPGSEIFAALRERKIFVRRWDLPRIGDYLRITVGSEEETDALIAALREILAAKGVNV